MLRGLCVRESFLQYFTFRCSFRYDAYRLTAAHRGAERQERLTHVESDCRPAAAHDDHGVVTASELVYGESGAEVVPGCDGDQPVSRAVCGCVIGVSAGAGSGGAGHRDGRRLPVRPGCGRAELDELSAASHARV